MKRIPSFHFDKQTIRDGVILEKDGIIRTCRGVYNSNEKKQSAPLDFDIDESIHKIHDQLYKNNRADVTQFMNP